MVIRGRTRGNGQQLARYLLAEGENELVQILDVNGKEKANDNDLRHALLSMSLTSELTKSDKGLYHVQLNPAYGEDKLMTKEKWLLSAELLEKETGYEGQRRVIILHTKKGRTHAHVVYERYDHEKGVMKSDSYSRLAQDRARKAMEKALGHAQTPDRNVNRPEMKKFLTGLWNNFKSGKDFISEAKKAGYRIAAGLQRPFMVVDKEGRSFDLVRQLDKIKTSEVKVRLKDEKLISEKNAIETIRQQQKLELKKKQETIKEQASNDNNEKNRTAQLFAQDRQHITKDDPKRIFEQRKILAAEKFREMTGDVFVSKEKPDEKKDITARSFAENKKEQLSKDQEIERLKQGFMRPGKKERSKDYEPD